MSAFLLCSEPSPMLPQCAEQFYVRASGWIDEKNFGGVAPELAPSGVRLRWNLPFLSEDPEMRSHGYPSRFIVRRSSPIREELFEPNPTAGQLPRTIAPAKLWRNMDFTSDTLFVASRAADCAEAIAIYFELHSDAEPAEITLLDVDGETLAVAYVKPNDRFYYETFGLRSVAFSERPRFSTPIRCLGQFDEFDVELATIATVDARIWITESLDDIAARVSRSDGRRYLSIDEDDWSTLQKCGTQVIAAHDGGQALEDELVQLEATASLKWEVAALLGWGFIDGEHPAGSGYDQIDKARMLPQPTQDVFAYQIVAEFPDGARLVSTPFFVRARHLAPLTAPNLHLVDPPTVTLKTVNVIDIAPNAETPAIYPTPEIGKRPSPDEEECFCAAHYVLSNDNAFVERVSTTPVASDSTLANKKFLGLGEYVADLKGGRPPIIDGLKVREERRFNFEVPFVDSEIWLTVVAGDFWDRSIECPDTDHKSLLLDYAGRCAPLERATCNSAAKSASLELQATPAWKGDILARLLTGTIQLLGQRTDVTRLEIPTRIGPAFAEPELVWSTVIERALTQTERDRLVDGMLEAGGLIFRIVGFREVQSALRCIFEAPAECGAIAVFPSTGQLVDAVLREAGESEWLWKDLGEIPIDANGAPLAMLREVDLNRLGDLDVLIPHSMTLYFATRLAVRYDGQLLVGPTTIPAAAPYIHSLPDAPDLCVAINQIGRDYYGRAFIRLETESCEEFDPRFSVRTTCARDAIDDQQEMQEKQSLGLFRPQPPMEGRVVFEAFEMLSNAGDDDRFTVGVAYVREADDMEGEKKLFALRARENGG